jgi:hypothetical protein
MTSTPPSALAAPVLLALVMLGLLTVGERVGLPGGWVHSFFIAVLLLTLLAVLWLARTTQERAFLGSSPALATLTGAMVLTIVTSAAVSSLVPSSNGPQWLGSLAGVPFGLLLAHGVARKAHRRANNPAKAAGTTREDSFALVRGLAPLCIGMALGMTGLGLAQTEIARLLSLTAGTGMALAAGTALLAVLVGGLRASLIQAALLSLATIVALGLMLVIGLIHLGPLPLPGLSDFTTLTAIAEARVRWGITTPLQLVAWPDWTAALHEEGLRNFALSCLIATGIALAVSPGLPVRRRSLTGLAVAGTIILPLAVMAIAGYAIEAAAINFVNASVARPPPALVETAHLGLISVCGVNADTAEALRMSCGVSPRDAVALAWGQIGLSPPFIRSGLGAAFGYPAAVSMTIGIITLAWMMAMATLGLALAAQGLGLHILARNHQAAGLASLRLGLVRLAALLLAAALTMPVAARTSIDATLILSVLATGCGLVFALGLRSAFRKPAETSVSAEPVPPTSSRKRKPAALPGGEPA